MISLEIRKVLTWEAVLDEIANGCGPLVLKFRTRYRLPSLIIQLLELPKLDRGNEVLPVLVALASTFRLHQDIYI